jgi:hypothetical protein
VLPVSQLNVYLLVNRGSKSYVIKKEFRESKKGFETLAQRIMNFSRNVYKEEKIFQMDSRKLKEKTFHFISFILFQRLKVWKTIRVRKKLHNIK